MAPVVNNMDALNFATEIARPKLVVVESFVVKNGARRRYRSCNGFILHVLNGRVYVAVPQSKIDRKDVIAVRLHNGVEGDAKFCGTCSDLYILQIVVAGDFESVNIRNLPPEGSDDRIDVVILAQAKMVDDLRFNVYSTSMIFPTNESRFFPESTRRKIFQDPAFSTIGFSANMQIDAVVGAPVFDFNGDFVGIINSFEDDTLFVRSSQFIPELRTRLEAYQARTSTSANTNQGQG